MALTKNQKARRALQRILNKQDHPVITKAIARVAEIKEQVKDTDLTFINRKDAKTTTFALRHETNAGLMFWEERAKTYELRDAIKLEKTYNIEDEQKINFEQQRRKQVARRTHAMTKSVGF